MPRKRDPRSIQMPQKKKNPKSNANRRYPTGRYDFKERADPINQQVSILDLAFTKRGYDAPNYTIAKKAVEGVKYIGRTMLFLNRLGLKPELVRDYIYLFTHEKTLEKLLEKVDPRFVETFKSRKIKRKAQSELIQRRTKRAFRIFVSIFFRLPYSLKEPFFKDVIKVYKEYTNDKISMLILENKQETLVREYRERAKDVYDL